MRSMHRAILALLLCLSLCLILAPSVFAEGEGIYPVRLYNEKNYDLVGLKVLDAAGNEIVPAENGDGFVYLLAPGTYSYVYHDDRGIFLDIEETHFSIGNDAAEIPVTLTAWFADEIGFSFEINPDLIGQVEEITPEEREQKRQEMLDRMIRDQIAKSETEQPFAVGDHMTYNAGEDTMAEVYAAVMNAMLQHQEETRELIFYTGKAWDLEHCREIIKNSCVHTGNQREGDTLNYGHSRYGYSFYPDQYDESTGMYRHDVYITLEYRTTLAQEQTVASRVESLVRELGISGQSDYQKALAINQWLYTNVNYDYANLEDTTYTLKFTDYAALIDKVAVCQGFALAFYRLALEAGLDARYIRSAEMNHAWNIVRINGIYYELDSTWDSNIRQYYTDRGYSVPNGAVPEYFLRGSGWWLNNHTLDGQTYSTIGDQFYSDTEDYDPLFNTYALSAADFDPANDVPPGVAVSAANFPDPVFRAYVSDNFDTDRSGYLDDAEIAAVIEINVRGSSKEGTQLISSLKGIEFFPSLAYLDCAGNTLKELDVSQNTALEGLICGIMDNDGNELGNQLSKLDVSKNKLLGLLYCCHNQITTLDVSGNTNLLVLYCYNNGMTQLNTNGCTKLAELSCGNNQLTTLNMSSCSSLRRLSCFDNPLTSFDITPCPVLVYTRYAAEPLVNEGVITYYDTNYDGSVSCDETDVILIYGLLDLPTDLTEIEEEAFAGGSFTYVLVPEGTVSVGPRAFANCPNLAYVLVRSAETAIDPSAFEGSNNVSVITLAASAVAPAA